MNAPTTYYGTWQIPDARGVYIRKFSGTLTYYGDKPSTLEVIHEPRSGSISTYYHYDVIWGEDAGGMKFSLFDASYIQEHNFSKTSFLIRYILLGKHVQSLDEPCFDCCWVKYTFLNRWALDNRFDIHPNNLITTISLDIGNRPAFLSVEIEKRLRLMLWGNITDNINRYEISATQATNLNIDTPKNVPMTTYLKTVSEFSQFLSIALFAEQHPSEVYFANKGVIINYPLLFYSQTSTEPWVLPLIKFDELKEKMPSVLKQWHSNYEQISPICKYLIRSLKTESTFDAPEFLIVAQALDGYFKRFVNNKDGKEIKQYKRQIEKLIDAFKDIDVIKTCNLDADVLTQSRHKYSHLIPDSDRKITKAVEGEDLYWLTQKCIVLLTCCILDMLGLTNEEINLCCNNSPIEQIANSIPF
jgi:hypothetical protein